MKTATLQAAAKSFEQPGIWPLNRNIIPDAFAASITTDVSLVSSVTEKAVDEEATQSNQVAGPTDNTNLGQASVSSAFADLPTKINAFSSVKPLPVALPTTRKITSRATTVHDLTSDSAINQL